MAALTAWPNHVAATELPLRFVPCRLAKAGSMTLTGACWCPERSLAHSIGRAVKFDNPQNMEPADSSVSISEPHGFLKSVLEVFAWCVR